MHPIISMDKLRTSIVTDYKRLNSVKQEISLMKKNANKTPAIKDAERSKQARVRGNEHYNSDLFDSHERAYHLYQTLHIYNESVAYAPIGSQEIALAYANRSAVLRRMHRYEACISEIDKALDIITSSQLKVKLMCRKSECLTYFDSESESGLELLHEAEELFEQMEAPANVNKTLLRCINKASDAQSRDDDPDSDDEGLDEGEKWGERIQDSTQLLTDAEKTDISNSVRVECSEEYGRHLVAARDFEPGEIIMVEKPYHTQTHWTTAEQYCYHCLNYLWTVVPCDHCPHHLFCSEKCKITAWNEYHELECPITSHLRAVLELETNPFIPFIIGIFCKALKEAGSIGQLRVDLESLDQYNQVAALDAPILSYKSMYTTPVRNLEEDENECVSLNSIISLIGLAKYSSVLGRTYGLNQIEGLMKNDTALFVGAFFRKISWIIASKCSSFKLYSPSEHVMMAMQREYMLGDQPASVRAVNLSLDLASMLCPVGCIPNLATARTYDTKTVAYALQPIKAGTRLVANSGITVYDHSKTIDRQPASMRYFNRPCNCQACTENWSETIRQPTKNKGELWKEMNSIWADWDRNSGVPDYPNIKVVNRIKKLVAKTWIEYPMPSAMYVHVVRIMNKIFQIFFTPSEIFANSADLHEIKI